jgi:hypothetical protein
MPSRTHIISFRVSKKMKFVVSDDFRHLRQKPDGKGGLIKFKSERDYCEFILKMAHLMTPLTFNILASQCYPFFKSIDK